MDRAERERLYREAVSRPASWYVQHPNADRAVARILERMAELPLVDEHSKHFGALRPTRLTPPRRPRGRRRVPYGPRCSCPLHPRELECVGGLAAGLSEKQIAAALGLRQETVKWYLKRASAAVLPVERRLRGQTSTRLVALAVRSGWV